MATNVRYIAHMPAEQENRMVSMNVSVPEALRDYAQSRSSRGFGSVSEYVRELIRRDREWDEARATENAVLRRLADNSLSEAAIKEAIDGLRTFRSRITQSGRGMTQDEIKDAIDEGMGW